MTRLLEGGVAPGPVDRDPQDLGPEAMEFGAQFVVKGHLVAAHRAEVGGVEDQHHRIPPKLRERDLLVRGGVQREVWCRRARRKFGVHDTSPESPIPGPRTN